MTAPPELIFVHCDDCGCRISRPRLGGTYRCEDCKRRRKQAQNVASEGRHLDCTRRWKILRDVLPYEDGGFSPGATENTASHRPVRPEGQGFVLTRAPELGSE